MTDSAPRLTLATAAPVWGGVVIAVLLAEVLLGAQRALSSLPVVLAGAVLGTFAIQLFLPGRTGLVNRVVVSVGGVALLLLVATMVLGAAILWP